MDCYSKFLSTAIHIFIRMVTVQVGKKHGLLK